MHMFQLTHNLNLRNGVQSFESRRKRFDLSNAPRPFSTSKFPHAAAMWAGVKEGADPFEGIADSVDALLGRLHR